MKAQLVVATVTLTATGLAGCASAPQRSAASSPSPTASLISSVPSAPALAATAAPTARGAYPTRCRSAGLTLTLGGYVSEATGQHTTMLVLTNVGATGCYLIGYPGVALAEGSGAQVPFVYRRGGDQMITDRPPGVVELAPRSSAYFAINKYRCDLGDKQLATAMIVTPPGDTVALHLLLPEGRGVEYCGRDDPGTTVDISPIEATQRLTAPS